jgi:predicted ATPase/DNA-binding winged helix-turn-helix (wHTH) protein
VPGPHTCHATHARAVSDITPPCNAGIFVAMNAVAQPIVSPDVVLAFGPFRLLPQHRLLLEEGGVGVELGGRAFDLLTLLAERAGEVVSKRELIARAWPGSNVEESSLRVQINALRRVLGDGHPGRRFIANIPGRGYSLVVPVERLVGVRERPAPGAPAQPRVPAALSRIVGREDTIALLRRQSEQRRLVSIVGPGGIGKSTVAVATAHALAGTFGADEWFVDLGVVDHAEQLLGALASAVGATPQPEAVERALGGRPTLLVLDNCEHLIDAVAHRVLHLLGSVPELHVVTTSRQPLRISGEWVHRLAPLTVPAEGTPVDAVSALQFTAVQLFVERAVACADDFVFEADEAALVVDLCRRIDGIPLAIEVVAARVPALGLRGLAARLDDRFLLQTQGQRTAVPRHRSLRAAMDWSYDLLRTAEQRVLCCLAQLQGGFTLEAAITKADQCGVASNEAIAALFDLVEKSLVVAESRCDSVVYRLLHVTRAHARDQVHDTLPRACDALGLASEG